MTTVTDHAPHQAFHTEIVDPADIRRDRYPDHELCASAFLASLRNRNTRTNYATSLKAWFCWCEKHDLDPLHHVQRSHIEVWIRTLEEHEGLAASTIAGRLNAMSGYYKRAEMDGWRTDNPCRFVARPYIQRITTSNNFSLGEIHRVLNLADKRGNERDIALLNVLAWNGIRVGELVGIDVGDVGHDRGLLTIRILRKGGNSQTLPLNHRTSHAVTLLIGDRTEGPLFLSMRTSDKRICHGDVQRLVKRYAKWAGIQKRVSPHSFRHSFVTMCKDAGIPDREIQRSCGHADSRMLAYYDHGSGTLLNDPTFRLLAYAEQAR